MTTALFRDSQKQDIYQDTFLNFSLKKENVFPDIFKCLFPFFLKNCASTFIKSRNRLLMRWKPSSSLSLGVPVDKHHSYHPCRWDRALSSLAPSSIMKEATFHVDISHSLGLVYTYPCMLGPIRSVIFNIWHFFSTTDIWGLIQCSATMNPKGDISDSETDLG